MPEYKYERKESEEGPENIVEDSTDHQREEIQVDEKPFVTQVDPEIAGMEPEVSQPMKIAPFQ